MNKHEVICADCGQYESECRCGETMNKELLLTEVEKLEILGYDTEKMVTVLGDVRRLLEAQHAKTSGHYEKKLSKLAQQLFELQASVNNKVTEERVGTLREVGEWLMSKDEVWGIDADDYGRKVSIGEIEALKSGTMPTGEVRE